MITIISANQTEKIFELDYKTFDYMLMGGNAEQYDSAKSLFENYDAINLENQEKIVSAKTPLYVIHNVDNFCFEYTPVYDASLNLVGFLD